MLYKMVLTLGAGYSETFQLKATEYYFPLIMFILLTTLFFFIRIYFIRISRMKFLRNFKNILRIKPRLRF